MINEKELFTYNRETKSVTRYFTCMFAYMTMDDELTVFRISKN